VEKRLSGWIFGYRVAAVKKNAYERGVGGWKNEYAMGKTATGRGAGGETLKPAEVR
jgi:hypothetical protein